MSKRDYVISRRAGATMWTCEVTDSYGETHTNYFETTRECDEHIYYTWENEVSRAFLKHAGDDLLAKAILECKEIDSKNKNLREIL